MISKNKNRMINVLIPFNKLSYIVKLWYPTIITIMFSYFIQPEFHTGIGATTTREEKSLWEREAQKVSHSNSHSLHMVLIYMGLYFLPVIKGNLCLFT